MPEATVKVINPLGLHARAAAQLVKVAGSYDSSITISRIGSYSPANARSILALLTLAASRGCELQVNVSGEDSEEAIQAVVDLFVNGFGEL